MKGNVHEGEEVGCFDGAEMPGRYVSQSITLSSLKQRLLVVAWSWSGYGGSYGWLERAI